MALSLESGRAARFPVRVHHLLAVLNVPVVLFASILMYVVIRGLFQPNSEGGLFGLVLLPYAPPLTLFAVMAARAMWKQLPSRWWWQAAVAAWVGVPFLWLWGKT